MDWQEFVQQDPEQVERKIAAVAVLQRRLGQPKTADIHSIAQQIQSAVTDGLASGDPRYWAGTGAAALGGLSLAREMMQPARKRRLSNALAAAGLGGILGGVAPVAGQAIQGAVSGPAPGSMPPVERSATEKMIDGTRRAVPAGVRGLIRRFPFATGAGVASTKLYRGAQYPSHLMNATQDAIQNAKGEAVVQGVSNTNLDSAVRHLRQAPHSGSLRNRFMGLVDQHIAARRGLPDVEAMRAAGYTPSAQPFEGQRWNALLGRPLLLPSRSIPMVPPAPKSNVLRAVTNPVAGPAFPSGLPNLPPHTTFESVRAPNLRSVQMAQEFGPRAPMPMIGGLSTEAGPAQVARTLGRKSPGTWIPTLIGAGLDIARNLR